MKLSEESVYAYVKHNKRYAPVVVALILVVLTIARSLTAPNVGAGITPGDRIPPFAVPLALGHLNGDANIATHANDGAAGKPARVRGARAGSLKHLPAL